MIRLFAALALTFYSVTLLVLEYQTSQDYIRNYFTDISGPVLFFAVNTTLSVGLLWGTALVFMIHVRLASLTNASVDVRMFLWSQCLLFAWLGFDDRFQAHERIAYRLDIGDHYVLLIVALTQLGLLFRFRYVWLDCVAAARYLMTGAGLFSVMLLVDACVPHEMRLRLSIEDLAKTWGTVMLFLYAWELLFQRFDYLAMSEPQRTVARLPSGMIGPGVVNDERGVLVLGEDSRMVLPIARSLGRRGIPVDVAWAPANASFLRSRYVRQECSLPIPTPEGSDWQGALINLAQSEKYALIIPATEMATYAIHQCRQQFNTCTPLAILNEQAFEIAFDKHATHRVAARLKVPVPKSVLVESESQLRELTCEMTRPLVVKATCSVDTHQWRSKHFAQCTANKEACVEAATQLLASGSAVVLQEFFVGRGVGVEFLAIEGRLLYVFQHERLHETVGYGSTYRRSVPLDERLVECVQRIISEVRYCGIGMAEFRVSDDQQRFVLLEINGRFWGSLPLAIASGADFPYFLYRALVHKQREFAPDYRTGVRCRHLLDDLRWQWRALRGKFDQHHCGDANSDGWAMNRRSRSQVIWDALRVVLPGEHIDSFAIDDPDPAFSEVVQILRLTIKKTFRRRNTSTPIPDALQGQASPSTSVDADTIDEARAVGEGMSDVTVRNLPVSGT